MPEFEPLIGGGAENVDVIANGEQRSVGTVEDGADIRVDDVPVQVNIDGEVVEVDPSTNNIQLDINHTGKATVEEWSTNTCFPGEYGCRTIASISRWSALEAWSGGSIPFSPSDIEDADELYVKCTGDNNRIIFRDQNVEITSQSDIEQTITGEVDLTKCNFYIQASGRITLRWRNNVEKGVQNIRVD